MQITSAFDGFHAVADLLQSVFLDNKNDKSHFMIVDKTTTAHKKRTDYSFDGLVSTLKGKKVFGWNWFKM